LRARFWLPAGWLALLPALGLAQGHNDLQARDSLRSGAAALAAGQPADARTAWDTAFLQASANLLKIEALARQYALDAPTSAYSRDRVGRLMAYFDTTPPAWLSEDARAVVQHEINGRRASGAFPELVSAAAIGSQDFAAPDVASGFHGRRYYWIAPLRTIPPPSGEGAPGVPLGDEPDIQGASGDALPPLRLPLGPGRWAVADPPHTHGLSAAKCPPTWRFDRCLLGYSLDPLFQTPDLEGRLRWVPTEPWYPDQTSLWRLRFRVFYPSPPLTGGVDLQANAEQLLGVLLRAHWIDWEYFGREARDTDDRLATVDVWLTPTRAEDDSPIPGEPRTAGECREGNLYFFEAARDRQPGEWVRQAIHEYGHRVMPHLGRYSASTAYETWLDGNIGERLTGQALQDNLTVTADVLPPWLDAIRDGAWWAAYRRARWDPLVAGWLAAGPSRRDLLGDRGDAGAQYVLGWLMRLADLHDPAFVRDFLSLDNIGANLFPTANDLDRDYAVALAGAKRFALRTKAACQRVGTVEPRLTPLTLELPTDCRVNYLFWLPAGSWLVRLVGPQAGQATLAIDGVDRQIRPVAEQLADAGAARLDSEGRWLRLELGGYGANGSSVSAIWLERSGR
jgi:hypothetical protein